MNGVCPPQTQRNNYEDSEKKKRIYYPDERNE
jgi:hypothetical protein